MNDRNYHPPESRTPRRKCCDAKKNAGRRDYLPAPRSVRFDPFPRHRNCDCSGCRPWTY